MEELQPSPKVSVLLLSCNRAGPLRRCLESLERSQDRENLEIVVVDNGSRDESPQLDAEFPRVQMLRMPRHFGDVKALNIGMRTASGEFVFFLPPDGMVLPDTIPCLARELAEAPDATAVCPLTSYPDGLPVFRHRRIPSPQELYVHWRAGDFKDWTEPDLAAGPLAVQYLELPVLMVRRRFLAGMRFIDERYSHSHWHLEICCQIRRAGKKVLLIPTARVVWEKPAPRLSSIPPVRALLSADEALGASTFVAKHYGWAEGLKLRLKVTFAALGAALASLARFRDVRYHFARLSFLLDGQKLDGSQRMI